VTSDEQTFLFADMAGFTALTEVHGDEHAAELVADFCDEVARRLPGHEAEQIKSIGDAVLVRVPSAAAAIRLGLQVVNEIGGRHSVPVIRVGMHTGTAVERAGDWFGASVNLAARVAAVAAGGEVLITHATRQAAGALPDIDLDDLGTQRFRHVTEPVRLYAARPVGSARRTLPIDPVCHMAVDPEHAWTIELGGRKMYFCSGACASAFEADPEAYTDVRRA
jgi:adenylate cyclase